MEILCKLVLPVGEGLRSKLRLHHAEARSVEAVEGYRLCLFRSSHEFVLEGARGSSDVHVPHPQSLDAAMIFSVSGNTNEHR
jgi:hypothetical protein